jgi:protease YdgD
LGRAIRQVNNCTGFRCDKDRSVGCGPVFGARARVVHEDKGRRGNRGGEGNGESRRGRAVADRVSLARKYIAAFALTLFAGAVAAETPTQAGADLERVNIAIYPWSSIGKLNNSIGGSCTAAVIGQNSVLTAAHCIFNRRTKRFLSPSSLHVLFGYERGQYAVHGLVGSYSIDPGYDPELSVATLSSDWAVLKLVEPLPSEIRPLKLINSIPTPGSRLVLGSYARGRRHVLTVDKNCQLLGQVSGSTLIEHDCQVAEGSSGAPLLILEGEVALIIGIQVAAGQRKETAVMLAVSAPSITNKLASH